MELDRFARSALDALQWLQQLDAAGIGFKILTQDIDTTTAYGRLVFTILAAVAELERETIRERVKAGMERGRAEGKQVGRSRRVQPVTEHPAWPKVLEALHAGHLNRAEAARKLKVRKATMIEALAPNSDSAPMAKRQTVCESSPGVH
jgi:DNA invertase Pin-like site-specific DNA recombinase